MGIMILGTGGHAKVALDILLEMKETVEGFLDDNPEMHGKKIHSYPVIGAIADYKKYGRRLVMGIGDNKIKKAIFEKLGMGPTGTTSATPRRLFPNTPKSRRDP